MFADLDQISTASHSAPLASSNRGEGRGQIRVSAPVAGAKVSAAEAPLREEVQHKLQHLPPALLNTCQQVSAFLPACLSVCPFRLSFSSVLFVCLSVLLFMCECRRAHALEGKGGGEGGRSTCITCIGALKL